MSSFYTQSCPLLATGATNFNSKRTTMTMIQQPNTVVSPPPPKKLRNQPGNPNPDAEVIALSPETITTTNRFLCEVCYKGFNREQNLQIHRRVHNLPWKLKQKSGKEVRRKVYISPEATCIHHDPSRALGDFTGIKKHYYRKHCEKKWKCEKCPKSYALQADWKNHSRICGTKVYGCVCGTPFHRRYNYILHKTFCDALKQEPARNHMENFPEMGAAAGGSGGRQGFNGFAASALSHNHFGNNSNTGLTPPAADYNLNRSASEKFEKLVPQPTNPNPGPTNFLMQCSSNQGLLPHNDQTLKSQHNLISPGDRIHNNNNITNLSNRDFYASAFSALCGHGLYGGAASALPHNQFGNNLNTGLTPPAVDYNLNRSSSETYQEFVSPSTSPNPDPTNFLKLGSSNQGLLAHNDHTLMSQYDLISLSDRINNKNNSLNHGYFHNNTQNYNQALFTPGAANNDPHALPSSSSSFSSVVTNGFGQNQNGNIQGLRNSPPVTKFHQGWSGSNIFGPRQGNNLSMGGSNMLNFDFLGVKGGIVSNGRNPAPQDTEKEFAYPNNPFGNF